MTEFEKREVTTDEVKRLLKVGRALILLDGLDEVKKEDDRRVKQDIDRFSRDWLKNRFAITCRIAAREYQFEKFTEVEVADFDDGQIATFVNNWFRERDESKAERLLERLKGNQPVKELAKSPLLLSLLCWSFEGNNEFPENRHDLLKEGLNFLLKKWDETRSVERDVSKHFRGEQIYKNLAPEEKIDMISGIAFRYFLNGEYFFRQEDLQQQIKDYICKLPKYSNNLEALHLDSESVLKAIEHHHGLLVERARNIYSFSLLTFQEYFAAREIERDRNFEKLIENISNPRWKEVFYLTVEMLRRSDDFLKMMKNRIDGMMANDEKLQAFLEWVNHKTNSVEFNYKTVAVRAFYIYVAFRDRDLALAIDRNLAQILVFCRDLSCRLDSHLSRALVLDLDRARNLDSTLALVLDRVLNREKASLHKTQPTFMHKDDLSQDLNSDINLARAFSRAVTLDYVIEINDGKFREYLKALKDNLPSNQEIFSQWWENDGTKWQLELRQVCIEHRNICHDWQFTDKQVELLKNYCETNLLLVECMNRSDVSEPVREEIESTMLLPSKK